MVLYDCHYPLHPLTQRFPDDNIAVTLLAYRAKRPALFDELDEALRVREEGATAPWHFHEQARLVEAKVAVHCVLRGGEDIIARFDLGRRRCVQFAVGARLVAEVQL